MEIYDLSFADLTNKLNKKEISSEDIVKSSLDRIEQTENKINAFNFISTKSLDQAKNIDNKRVNDEKISRYAGIPISLKDNICVNDMSSTCSSKILENFVSPYNATVVEKLNNENIIVLGKTNMDEFAMGSSTENSAFKLSSNPWDLNKVPGGSSGGSAASVASRQVSFSLGSDTGGSVRQPASFCGVVGMKPTYGSISRYGLIAYASSLDQIGPLTRNVEDNAMLLNIITGHDEKDSTSINKSYDDFTKLINNDIKGMKIGLPKQMFDEGIDPEVKDSVLSAVKKLESLGARVDEISLPISKYTLSAYYIIATAEASSNLSRFDGIRYGLSKREGSIDLESLYLKTRTEGFGDEVKMRIMLGTYVLSAGYYDAYYKKALKVRTLIVRELNDIFSNYDVIICPTSPMTAFNKGEKTSDPMSMYMTDILTVIANLAGIPALSMPCGFDSSNLPIGLQVMSKPLNESVIYQIANNLEKSLDLQISYPNLA